MSFRIQNNPAAVSSLRNLENTQKLMTKLVERLASGKRIASAAADAAGMAAASRFRAGIASMETAYRNVAQADSTVQVAEGAMSQVGDMLVRMNELATQAASGTAGADLSSINAELSGLESEINRIAGATTFNGRPLLDGTFSTEFQVGEGSDPDSRIGMSLDEISMATLSGGAPFQVDASTPANAQAALGEIKNAVDYLAEKQASIGAVRNRLSYASSNLEVSLENKIAAESTIGDVDYAMEMANFTKARILEQADTAMLAHAMVTPAQVLSLIK